MLSHLRLVVAVARNYMGYGLPQADLIQEGNVGLMKAVRRFDPERGVRLASFAIHWIKAEIHEYILRNWRLVKVATTKAQRKLFFNLRSLKSSTRHAHAHRGRHDREDARGEGKRRGGDGEAPPGPRHHHRSLAGGRRGARRARSPSWPTPPRARPTSSSATRRRTSRPRASPARSASLDDRSRRIVEARWLAEGEPKTLHELADEFGVSAERIRQIEAKALQKMKGEPRRPALSSLSLGRGPG